MVKTKQRMKGDNLALFILIVIIIAIALFCGIDYGYELGIKKSNSYYSTHIRNHCICYIPVNIYKTERVIPLTLLNLSLNDS